MPPLAAQDIGRLEFSKPLAVGLHLDTQPGKARAVIPPRGGAVARPWRVPESRPASSDIADHLLPAKRKSRRRGGRGADEILPLPEDERRSVLLDQPESRPVQGVRVRILVDRVPPDFKLDWLVRDQALGPRREQFRTRDRVAHREDVLERGNRHGGCGGGSGPGVQTLWVVAAGGDHPSRSHRLSPCCREHRDARREDHHRRRLPLRDLRDWTSGSASILTATLVPVARTATVNAASTPSIRLLRLRRARPGRRKGRRAHLTWSSLTSCSGVHPSPEVRRLWPS